MSGDNFVVLSLPAKISILNELQTNPGLQPVDMVQRYCVSVDQINDIVLKRDEILRMFKSACYRNALQMPLGRGKYPKMENVLYQWYLEQPKKSRITRKMFAEKAIQILRVIGEPVKRTFCGSSVWMVAFKRRFNIEQPNLTVDQRVMQNGNNSLNNFNGIGPGNAPNNPPGVINVVTVSAIVLIL